MNSNPREHFPAVEEKSSESAHPTRRAFVLSAAGACGALGAIALWPFGKPSPVAASASGAADSDVTVIQFSPDGKKIGKVKLARVVKSEAEWEHQLSPISFAVARHAGTEQPYTGSTWDLHDKGIFRCVCCDLAVFSSDTKFESGTGWPSFWQPIARENVAELRDTSLGMARTAVSCTLCAAHLGHVFDDGPRPTGQRYCMNSAAMHFVKQT
jgi:peptide-methionine (R)-S-oxide reductase